MNNNQNNNDNNQTNNQTNNQNDQTIQNSNITNEELTKAKDIISKIFNYYKERIVGQTNLQNS